MTATAKQRPKPEPETSDGIQLEVVGKWTDEHTKVIAQLLVDLEDVRRVDRGQYEATRTAVPGKAALLK